MLSAPLNLPKWLEGNSHLLKPPINNYCVYDGDMTVMKSCEPFSFKIQVLSRANRCQIVGGPNARSDYHINETPEWFYQYKGSMLLKVVDPADNSFRDISIHEGEMFLLPPNTPHNPVRFANTVGIVIEQPRPEKSLDRLRWYCQDCHIIVHEEAFHCTNLGTQIKAAVEDFKGSPDKRKCSNCGKLAELTPRNATQP